MGVRQVASCRATAFSHCETHIGAPLLHEEARMPKILYCPELF